MTSASKKFLAAIADYPDGSLGPHELCLCCVRALPVQRAAISVGVASDAWETLGASDATAERLEAQQILTGEGPSVDAVARGGPILVDDLATELDRWSGLTSSLGADARGAVFAFPLQIGAISVGVLDLGRDEPVPLNAPDMTAVLAVADIVTMVLLSRASLTEADGSPTDEWWTPSPSSSEIHQATGMVVAQLSAPARVAYLRLRAHAFANDLPLLTVARDVIERRLRFTVDEER
jgi:hypothetical protein